jgi:uncharacterized membrane protein
MRQIFIIGISAVVGAAVLGGVALTNTVLGLLMGALLGAIVAVAVFAFPLDLDYRERRIWPPKVP